ncbi:hypothetical protein [Caballeronia sp. ATUFL_M2_KS44]|uniref:hypothetical protein n=1 Tax=Caballeronia sp. ATUFL_M2_KS44 TaxID=2921767 RepID=UPI0020286B5C|nr:hypothetical protein [Caballeronia sp. ATUFL_M2_KS44]
MTFASTLSMNIAHATMRGAMKALTASGIRERDHHGGRSGDYGTDMEHLPTTRAAQCDAMNIHEE